MAQEKDLPIVDVEQVYSKTERYIEENKKSILIIFSAIVVLVGGYFLWKYWYVAGQEEEAQKAMYHAEMYFERDSLDKAINGSGEGENRQAGFLDIAEEYSVTNAGNLAEYYLGISYLRKGEYQNAIDHLEQFDSDDQIVSSVAIGAIGDAYMELKNLDEAIAHYLDAAKNNKNNFTSAIYLKKAGMAYEDKGNYSEAIKVYEQIKKDFPKSSEARDIAKYIARANTLAGN
jgi:tetratricopeptide (TPR) repeat protein